MGARADLHVLDAPSHDYLAYRVGVPLTYAVLPQRVAVVPPPIGGEPRLTSGAPAGAVGR